MSACTVSTVTIHRTITATAISMARSRRAVEIGCKDCHGTVDHVSQSVQLRAGRIGRRRGPHRAQNPDGRRRFEWINGELYQRSMLDPQREWRVSLVKDTVTPGNVHYNPHAARAKLMSATRAPCMGAEFPARAIALRSRQDGVLHVPYLVDDELRWLPSADRGQRTHRASSLRGWLHAHLRHLQSAGRA